LLNAPGGIGLLATVWSRRSHADLTLVLSLVGLWTGYLSSGTLCGGIVVKDKPSH
jgi:hypothetical protein